MGGINYFGVWDYIVVVATLALSLGIGLFYAVRGKQSNEEMLVGGRSMNPLPIAASMLVTYLSAITILGYPAEVYAYGVQISMMVIVSAFCVPISAFLFVTVFYKMRLTSVYEYLEHRFNSVVVRWLASFTFIFQVLLINAVVLYAPSIALDAILNIPVWVSITGIGLIGAVYTSLGGIKAVVWTDTYQLFMIFIGLVSIMVRGFSAAGGVSQAFTIAGNKGRLQIFDFTFDIFMRHNFWNFALGYGFAVISLYGTHQPQVQRYCSLPTLSHAIKAMLYTIPMHIFVIVLVIFTGISVFAAYSGCCPILLGIISKPDAIIPYFVVKELSDIPGLMGIFVSCIFSAVLSSISSTFNSLAAVTWEDFLSKTQVCKKMTPEGQTMCIRVIAALYGLVSIGLAFGAQHLGHIFSAVMTAVGATAGPLGGIFICALFLPCINKYGAAAGMVSGLVTMSYVAVQAFLLQRQFPNYAVQLPTDLDDCPEGTDFSRAKNTTGLWDPIEWEWPTKLYTVSYILYPFVGAVITASVGLLVSLLTGGFCAAHKVPKKYIHPVIRGFCGSDLLQEAEVMKGSLGDETLELQTRSAPQNDKYPYNYEWVVSPNGKPKPEEK